MIDVALIEAARVSMRQAARDLLAEGLLAEHSDDCAGEAIADDPPCCAANRAVRLLTNDDDVEHSALFLVREAAR